MAPSYGNFADASPNRPSGSSKMNVATQPSRFESSLTGYQASHVSSVCGTYRVTIKGVLQHFDRIDVDTLVQQRHARPSVSNRAVDGTASAGARTQLPSFRELAGSLLDGSSEASSPKTHPKLVSGVPVGNLHRSPSSRPSRVSTMDHREWRHIDECDMRKASIDPRAAHASFPAPRSAAHDSRRGFYDHSVEDEPYFNEQSSRPPLKHSRSMHVGGREVVQQQVRIPDDLKARKRLRSDEGERPVAGNSDEHFHSSTSRLRDHSPDSMNAPPVHMENNGGRSAHGPSLPASPLPPMPRRKDRGYADRERYGWSQGTRMRALSSNDQPVTSIPLVASTWPVSPRTGAHKGRRHGPAGHPSERGYRSEQGVADERRAAPSGYYFSEADARYRNSPEYAYNYTRAGDDSNALHGRGSSSATGPYFDEGHESMRNRRRSSASRHHRFHPYASSEARGFAHGYERFSSAATSPATSVASSPPLKGVSGRYRMDGSDGVVEARGMVGAGSEPALISSPVDGMHDGGRGHPDFQNNNHSLPRHSELAAPHNMKRTRNGWKYSCGIAGPKCHMSGCPVGEITQEYEYLKTIPEKDRWRPLVIPLGNRNHPQHVADYLKRWRLTHYDEPYLTKELSEHLRICLGLREEKQMSDWMTNARRRY